MPGTLFPGLLCSSAPIALLGFGARDGMGAAELEEKGIITVPLLGAGGLRKEDDGVEV